MQPNLTHITQKKKQISKIDILYSRYSRKTKKTTELVIFRLYSKGIVKPIDYITNKLCYIYIYIYKVQSWQDVVSQSSEAQ